MRIAIAGEKQSVSLHFGHCEEFHIYTVEEGRIVDSKTVPNPGHEPGVLPPFLAKHGVNCIIAGGMGPRAIQLFENEGITAIVGALGKVEDVIKQYVDGSLEVEDSACTHVE